MRSRRRALVAGVLLSLALLVVLGWDQAQMVTGWGLPERSAPPMLIVAHRGNTGAYPEDTAEAVWDAARLGADGIEFDVHQSADGTWWLIHDAAVDRTTDGSGLVNDLTDDALSALRIDAGRGYDPDRHQGIGLARLEDVLAGLEVFEGEVFADLQHAARADAADLATDLAGMSGTIICRSLDDVRAVEAAEPSVRTLIRADRIDGETGPDAIFLEAVGEATVGRVAGYSVPVITYMDERYPHLSQEVILRRAWAAGVDAFLAPELAAALEQRDRLAAGEDL